MMIKKIAFYLLAMAIVFAGQFLRSGDLVTGKPPGLPPVVINGARLPLADKGPAIIYFWARWCGVCSVMQDSLNSFAAEYPITTVAFRSGSDVEVGRYLQGAHLSWPVVNDPEGDIARNFGVKAVPALFFLNSEGNIVFTSLGYTSEFGLRLRGWLAGRL